MAFIDSPVGLYSIHLKLVKTKHHSKYHPNLTIVPVNIEKIKTDDKMIKGE
jgi:hypothetical protein